MAGYAGDEIDLEGAQDLADELVCTGRTVGPDGRMTTGRLRPFVEWAGGEYLMAAQQAADAAHMETMF